MKHNQLKLGVLLSYASMALNMVVSTGALIRYDGLYRRYPKVFDFDGPISGVAAPYPYAGRKDEE